MTFTCDQDHVYRDESGKIYLSVTQQLKIAGFVDFTMVPADTLAYAATRGKYIHDAVELWVYDSLDIEALDESYKSYVESYISFAENTGFQVYDSENIVFSERLRTAGIFDQLGRFPGSKRIALVELKSAATMPITARLQTAAYDMLAHEGQNSNPLTPMFKRIGLHLKNNGKYCQHVYNDRRDYSIFNNLCVNNWWALSNKIIPAGAREDEKLNKICKMIIAEGV